MTPANTSSFSTPVTQLQRAHRSIRSFKPEPIAEDMLQELKEVARATPSSTGQQRVSIIRVTDMEKRSRIAKICEQDYHRGAAEFWVFVVDLHRNYHITREKGGKLDYATSFAKFFQGFSDALLMAQNVSIAAESMGLGTVLVGSILNDPETLIKELGLPEYTFPALAISIGHPNEDPQLKPRLPLSSIFMENKYRSSENYLTELKAYDEEMTNYYDLRQANKRVDCFSDQVVRFSEFYGPLRERVFKVLTQQGFKDISEPEDEK